MFDLKVSAAKGQFFDRERVLRATDRAERRVLSKFGAFVRQRAITSILRHPVRRGFGVKSKISNRDGVSPPGKPPYTHTGLLVRHLFFAFDPGRHSVIIGPAQLNKGRGLAPRLLEYGGETSILSRGRTRRARYRARPFMRPAFNAELQKMPGMFAGQVKE